MQTNFKFTDDKLGSQLLQSLTQGLYDEPKDVLREYFSNAADSIRDSNAQREEIHVEIQGNDLIISDWGSGMNESELEKALDIAISSKTSDSTLIGFRGIGIYASLYSCERLEIISTVKGSEDEFSAFLHFDKIVNQIDPTRTILDVLVPNILIEKNQTRSETQKTVIKLVNVNNEWDELINYEYIKRFITLEMPCKCNPKWGYYNELNSIYNSIAKFKDYEFTLKKGIDVEKLFKEFPSSSLVEKPISHQIFDSNQSLLAHIWYCPTLSTGFDIKKNNENKIIDLQLRVLNIKVGLDNPYATTLINDDKAITSHWQFGELHAIHDEIKPTANRDGLINTKERYDLKIGLTNLYQKLNIDRRVQSRFNKHIKSISKIDDYIDKKNKNKFTLNLRNYEKIEEDLKKHEKNHNLLIETSKLPSSSDPEKNGYINKCKQQKYLTSVKSQLIQISSLISEISTFKSTIQQPPPQPPPPQPPPSSKIHIDGEIDKKFKSTYEDIFYSLEEKIEQALDDANIQLSDIVSEIKLKIDNLKEDIKQLI